VNAPSTHAGESRPRTGSLQFAVGQCSVAGVKPVNEDAIGIRIPGDGLLELKGVAAVIADGVSAAEAGREASETCVSSFLSDYFSTPDTWSVKKSAQQVLTALNRWLYGRGQAFDESRKGYVTTMSVLVCKSRTAHLFHVGDSRIYRLRGAELEQLTNDHSTAISEDHSYLTRAVGLDVKLDVDYRTESLQEGDLFLLTTDGVHDFLDRQFLLSTLAGCSDDLETTCRQLVDAALASGSDDNLSCQLLRVDELPGADIDDVVQQLTELRFPPFLEPGMILDGYRIVRELHASNRSQVYQVEDIASGTFLCMKTPSVNFEDDPAYIERFVMEGWVGSRINSPYVVKVVEPRQAKTCLYYLTEYVSGMTLGQWMREHPQPAVEEAVFLIEQIAKGLRAFHQRETLHQDIKPDNLLIDANGRVKIIDFGSCSVAGIAEIATPLQRDFALGTATYSAPEYTTGSRPDYRADLFSLAVISFEMMTGKLPFDGKLEHCKSKSDFLNTRYTESYRLNPLVPHWIDGALRKSLRFLSERRHGDVMEFVYELQHPNPQYLEYRHRPLVERDPLTTWRVVAGLLALSQLAMLLYFLG
jgi:serine/threonine protein phosphatase PrpC